MTFALGSLGWTPDVFWNATYYEFSCAYVGYCIREGIGAYRDDPGFDSVAEVEAFLEDVEEMKKRFPDRPETKEERERRLARMN